MAFSTSAVIVAGGNGIRMQADIRKQYLALGKLPILCHTLAAFVASPLVHHIYLVVPETDFKFCEKEVIAPIGGHHPPVHLVAGGGNRQESVYHGLSAVSDIDGIVVIHDGVRPFVTILEIEACLRGAENYGACILGIPAVDTLKKVDEDGHIIQTVARQHIWRAQTPQAFQYQLIKKAHDLAISKGVIGTDDASLVERLGFRVRMIPGSPCNIKITTPEDLMMAQGILQGRSGQYT
ncbi:MAG: 2-C-methyl-D-erythritol 4-phosphate cytidylyltransferase [Desulfosalsimonadaceae bacterium]|nr:2-C-methyl-D-erythritol 4-phosphate cytidylyltransferase [Desulfosalsimonadaceae bacterium]